jgi:predicted outer membrane protein
MYRYLCLSLKSPGDPSEPECEFEVLVVPAVLEVKLRLSALNGAAFDSEYMRAQVTDHQKTVQLLLWVIASGENADLQRFASGTLPDVLHHLHLAQALVSQLTGAAAPPTN